MKHVHKLVWIGLFVNIIICFVARIYYSMKDS